jgi:hypothetical protein
MEKPTRTGAIKKFLAAKTHLDLAELYSHDMEVQVNVAQDGGDRIENEYQGRQWHGWTDGIQTWKSFRIPHKANSEPEYTDRVMSYDLVAHAEGIGMTGWDWVNKQSCWVAFDFDSILNHGDGLTNTELHQIQKDVSDIPWVTIRYSTSGTGLHLYVFLDRPTTKTHTEHAALARAILGMISATTSKDLKAKVDVCGGNHWVWHRKMKGNGLALVKQGSVLKELPINWCDHVPVIQGKRNKILPFSVTEESEKMFEEITGQNVHIPLDDTHKRLIEYLQNNKHVWWWDSDHHALVTHTYALKLAHQNLDCRGVYETLSKGNDLQEQNCFGHPLRNGAWVIRRFTPGASEAETWTQDRNGWTKCFFNREPDLNIAAKAFGGVEDTDGGFIFREAEVAMRAANLLGVHFELPSWLQSGRDTKLKLHKDGRLLVSIKHEAHDVPDDNLGSWLIKKGYWQKIFSSKAPAKEEVEVGNYDDLVRHLITIGGENAGWVIKAHSKWIAEPLVHVKNFLQGSGLNHKETTELVGSCISRPWVIVNQPFQDEYLSDRRWNRNSARLRFAPAVYTEDLRFESWTKILNHVGKNLDPVIQEHPWAKQNNIMTGADYLFCWLSSLFKEPTEPLPYLFLWGPQNSGKSIFHEAIELLIINGVMRVDAAVVNQGGFNAEIEKTVLCVIEELDLKANKLAYNKIKDWTVSRKILIHPKGQTPYMAENTTHFLHCANSADACPVFPGDSRITMIHVGDLEEIIPKRDLIPSLEKEAPNFLAKLLNLEIPHAKDRLNIPVIETEDKKSIQQANRTLLEEWLEDCCYYAPGHWIKYRDLYDSFKEWIDPNYIYEWSINRFGKELPKQIYPKGRNTVDAQWHVGNISFQPKETNGQIYVLHGDKLILEDQKC